MDVERFSRKGREAVGREVEGQQEEEGKSGVTIGYENYRMEERMERDMRGTRGGKCGERTGRREEKMVCRQGREFADADGEKEDGGERNSIAEERKGKSGEKEEGSRDERSRYIVDRD